MTLTQRPACCVAIGLAIFGTRPLMAELNCGTCDVGALEAIAVPTTVQYYEVVPCVIRSDGSETFRIFVHVGRAVARVEMAESLVRFSVSRMEFLDNGTDGDEAAGDGVYTSGVFTLNPPPHPIRFGTEAETLEGLKFETTGRIEIEETDGTVDQFLVEPSVGLLDPAIDLTPLTAAVEGFQSASHLVNLASIDKPCAQNRLHFLGTTNYNDFREMVQELYCHVEDRFDFLVVMSAMHGEQLPRVAQTNGFNGLNINIRNDTLGIGLPIFDDSALYGASGRLQSINLVDTGDRGVIINNVLHEVNHQWAAFVSFGLGLKSDSAHWHVYSNVGSLVGGIGWIPQADGSWLLDGEQSRGRLREMPPLDRYLAGFLQGDEVGRLMVYDTSSKHPVLRLIDGDPILPEEVVVNIGVEDIVAIHGERVPDVMEAQRHFNVLFVIESVDRLLTDVEMTFYNRLGQEFERLLAPGTPSPILANNWVPATRYFGRGVSVSSRVGGWDEDEDGLFDDWERTYFENLSPQADDDPDNDGLNHFEEMAYLCHPVYPDRSRAVRIFQTAEDVVLEITRFLPLLDYEMEIHTGNLEAPVLWIVNTPDTVNGPHLRKMIGKADITTGAEPFRMFARGRVEPWNP